MGTCLVTKLKGSISDSSLKKVGEMRIKLGVSKTANKQTRGLSMMFSKNVELKIIGDGYFTDETITENKGKTYSATAWGNGHIVYISNNSVELSISDKYSIVSISTYDGYKNQWSVFNPKEISFDIEDLRYSSSLESLKLRGTSTYGDLSSLANNTSLKYIDLQDTSIKGDIANLKNNANMTHLFLTGKDFYGDIASLSNKPKLEYLTINSSNVFGNISSLSTSVKLVSLNLTSTNISGDFTSLKNCSNMTDISVERLSGDLAIMPAKLVYANLKYGKFSWSDRPSTSKIIAITSWSKSTNIDKMLQDQANCVVGFTSSSDVTRKTISIIGDRTSASDSALQTLQSKGYTVSISPV